MIVTRDFNVIVKSYMEKLRAVIPEATQAQNAVLTNALVNAPAQQLAFLNNAALIISQLNSLKDLEGNDIDKYVSNFGLSRLTGNKSSGSVLVNLNGLANGQTIIVNQGAVVSGKSSAPSTAGIDFRVVATTTFNPVDRAIYEALAVDNRSALNSVGLRDVLLVGEVPIRALSSGLVGNVGSFTLTVINEPGVSTIINVSPTSGGTNEESDDSLRSRAALVFTGNSVGTAEGLLANVLTAPNILDAFVVKPGDLLLTRDGTIVEDGVIIKEGTGRAADIYCLGSNLTSQTSKFKWENNSTDPNTVISTLNALTLGTIENVDFGYQPVDSISSLTGSVSGPNFVKAIEVEDDEENIILEGNYVLIRDFEAEEFMIVRNVETQETKVATYLNPTSTRYVVLQTFTSSNFSNSAKGADSLLFLTDRATVENELLARGSVFNGADLLSFSNVVTIDEVTEEVNLSETIEIKEEVGFVIFLKHYPIISVESIENTRLGTQYGFEIENLDTGEIKLIGRFPPQFNDPIKVRYKWLKIYEPDSDYNLVGDSVKWLDTINERPESEGSVLLSEQELKTTSSLAVQPTVPTFLSTSLTGLEARSKHYVTFEGVTSEFNRESVVSLVSADDLIFNAGGCCNNIGRILNARNITGGYDYNLIDYQLATNEFDKSAKVNTNLSIKEFQFNKNANLNIIELGDQVRLSRKSKTVQWSSQNDFVNGIEDNLAPTFDVTQTEMTSSGDVILKTPLVDTTTIPLVLGGTIAEDTSLSGLIEIVDDLVVAEGVTLTIEPSTFIRVRESASLLNVEEHLQNVIFNPILKYDVDTGNNLNDPAIYLDEFFFIYEENKDPNIDLATQPPFFILHNDEGESLRISFNTDVLKKIQTGVAGEFTYTLGDSPIPDGFIDIIESTLDADNPSTTVKATFIGGISGNGYGRINYTVAIIEDYIIDKTTDPITLEDRYLVLLDKEPILSGVIGDDFELRVATSPSATFSRFGYESTSNGLLVEGNIVAIDQVFRDSANIITTSIPVDQIGNTITVDVDDISIFSVGDYSALVDDDTFPVIGTVETIGISSVDVKLITAARSTMLIDPLGNPEATDEVINSSKNAKIYVLQLDNETTAYDLLYDIEIINRISIRVEGSLVIESTTTPETAVVFTSAAGVSSAPGDWEGITFTSSSRSTEATAPVASFLKNCRVRYANTAVTMLGSDADVEDCVLRDNLNSGINIFGQADKENNYMSDSLQLTSGSFESGSRPGFVEADGLLIAEYLIPFNLLTANGSVPEFSQRIGEKLYVANLRQGVDYNLRVDGDSATEIDVDEGFNLADGVDYRIEFDTDEGFKLVFFQTPGTRKLTQVEDLVSVLGVNSGFLALDINIPVNNGIVRNNLIINNKIGIETASAAVTSIVNNTIHNCTLSGIICENTIADIENNIISDYQVSPIRQDNLSLIFVKKNDMFSAFVSDEERSKVIRTDVLLRDVSINTFILYVSNPNMFRSANLIQISTEQMMVQSVNDDSIIVARGVNGTEIKAHVAGDIVELFQLNNIFTVTGIPANTCEIKEVDIFGNPIPDFIPVQMRLIAPNTFRAAFPINRKSDFNYIYSFGDSTDIFKRDTNTKTLERIHPGVGVNDIYNVFHDLNSLGGTYILDQTNYFSDPLFVDSNSDNFNISEDSLANITNPMYSNLSEPNSLHRYVGSVPTDLVARLVEGDERVPVFRVPLIITAFYTDIQIIGISTNNEGVLLVPLDFTTEITSEEEQIGAVGVILLEQSVTLALAGDFRVSYNYPINLGTDLPSNPITSTLSYIYDALSEVDFTKIEFTHDDARDVEKKGGVIGFKVRSANDISELVDQTFSSEDIESPVLLEEQRGRYIEISIALNGNDASYSQDLEYLFPILRDFSLAYTPTKDNELFTVLSTERNATQDTTTILLDKEILSSTFANVGSDKQLDVFLRKRIDNFDEEKEFLMATSQEIMIGATELILLGDQTIVKRAPITGEVVKVDLMSVDIGSEELLFLQDNTQVTATRFSRVDNITHRITKDGLSKNTTSEKIAVNSVSQPKSGNNYSISYSFEAPIIDETLTTNFIYNDAIRTAQFQVEDRKSLFSDVLVRAAFTKDVFIGIELAIEAEVNANSVISNVTASISNYFSGLTGFGGRIDPSDIQAVITPVGGVEAVEITELNTDGSGTRETIFLTDRESARLADGQPSMVVTLSDGSIISI